MQRVKINNLRAYDQNGFTHPLLEGMSPNLRELQIKILATFMTPHWTFFSPAGRVAALDIINFRANSPAGIHLVKPEILADLFPDLKFVQNTAKKTIDFFKKMIQVKDFDIIKQILEKMGKTKEFVESIQFWIDNLLP